MSINDLPPDTQEKPRASKKGAVRTRKGTFKKGHSGNPDGPRFSGKQIFGTRSPFKQAAIRAVMEMSEQERVDALQDAARHLLEKARDRKKGTSQDIMNLAMILDGKPRDEAPPPSQTTFQLVLQNIRMLNLTAEQREQYRQLLQQHIDTETANPSGGSGTNGRTSHH